MKARKKEKMKGVKRERGRERERERESKRLNCIFLLIAFNS